MKNSSKWTSLIHTFSTLAAPPSKKRKSETNKANPSNEGESNDSNESNESKEHAFGDLEKMDVLDLQFLLESHGMSSSGEKPTLIARIKELFGLNESNDQDVGEG